MKTPAFAFLLLVSCVSTSNNAKVDPLLEGKWAAFKEISRPAHTGISEEVEPHNIFEFHWGKAKNYWTVTEHLAHEFKPYSFKVEDSILFIGGNSINEVQKLGWAGGGLIFKAYFEQDSVLVLRALTADDKLEEYGHTMYLRRVKR